MSELNHLYNAGKICYQSLQKWADNVLKSYMIMQWSLTILYLECDLKYWGRGFFALNEDSEDMEADLATDIIKHFLLQLMDPCMPTYLGK